MGSGRGPAGRGGLLAVLLAGFAGASPGAEIALFKLTGVEGYAGVRYLDDRATTSGGGSDSRQSQSEWRNEVFLMTHSYVYHPNFLTLDLGGGPILQMGEVASDGEAGRSRDALYNLVGRATFLRGKPVSGSVFFEHLNPTVSLSPGQVLNQETTRYGFDVSASAAVVPLPLRLEFTRAESSGRGADRILEDRSDQVNLRLSRSFGALGSTQAHFQASRQESMSGSANLPVQASTARGQEMNVDTRLQFGPDGRFELTNLVTLASRSYQVGATPLPDQTDASLLLDLRLKQSRELSGFAVYHHSYNDNGPRTVISRSAAAGATYTLGDETDVSIGAHADDSRADQVTSASHGIDGTARYQVELPLGTVQLSYGLRFDRKDQNAGTAQATVVGERVTLAGTAASPLSYVHASAGSIVVSNLTRSQVYVENLDYTITTVGSQTRLQRVVGGNILDGEEVLVDYSYDVGGTYAYDQLDQTFNLNWFPVRPVSVYFRQFHSSPELRSGAPTFPLNTVRSSLYGLRADLPLRFGVALTAGGTVEREAVDETISPFLRQSLDLYLQTEEPVFDLGNLGVSLRRMTLDYLESDQDMDIKGYGLRFTTRAWFGMDVSATHNYERDTGGPTPRERRSEAISLQWRERKLTVAGRLGRAIESQGNTRRDNVTFQVSLRREI